MPLDLDGLPVTLFDLAGLHPALDEAEQEGVRRARRRAGEADLRVFLFDAAQPSLPEDVHAADGDLKVANKADLVTARDRQELAHSGAMVLSCRTGEGLAELLAALEARVRDLVAPGHAPAMTRSHHRLAVQEASEALRRVLSGQPDLGMAAEDLRHAGDALGRITGRMVVDDVLDLIFGEFCIGK